MKLKNLVGDRFKERPSDCVIDSHAFSVRGGYIKYVANGIFSLYPPMKRITKKKSPQKRAMPPLAAMKRLLISRRAALRRNSMPRRGFW